MPTPFLLASTETVTENLSMLDPVSPAGDSIRTLFFLVIAITGAIFLLVEAILLFSVFRFRRKRTEDEHEPPQVYGSTPIEIAWTAAPTLVVFVMILVIVRTELRVEPTPPAPKSGDQALYVNVIGHQWWWEYVYQWYNGEQLVDLITANELHMPVSTKDTPRPLYLTVESADVCHSYWIPRLGGKMDLIPGHPNNLWLQAGQEGLFFGQCAEYCGTQHGNMLLRVNVESPERFTEWLKQQQKPAMDDPKEAKGRKVFLSQTCVSCHRIRGTSAKGTYAPDLTHLASRQTLASGMRPLTHKVLKDWIANPQALKPGCLMPSFSGLGDEDLTLLTDYLMSLK